MSTAAALDVHWNAFPGLRSFREDEEHLFFGRESQVDAMVDKLAATRLLAVVGTSGSGKSSLVNCGLRPALHGGLMARAGTAWRMAKFRPGSVPLRAMARALAEDGVLFHDYQAGGLTLAEIVETTLRMSKLGLIDIYEQAHLGEDVNLLLVVDQFEELFRFRRLGAGQQENVYGVSEEATAFVNLLLEAKVQTTYPIYVVLTMRSDFLGDCTQFTGLAEAVNAGQYLVPRMTRDERRAAISGPVGVGEAEISPVLLTRLVNDVGDNPDQLSILQHALNRTWARWRSEGGPRGPLDLAHYQAIGTMAHALDQHAEKAYAELATERQRQICEKLFKGLTDKATDPRGVRRPTTLGTLCTLADATEAEVTAVIDVFRNPSRSFLMPPAGEVLETETVVDISHESLMRGWHRLREWVDEEAQSAQTYCRLAETAALHAVKKASLWRDPDLQLALLWRSDNQPNETWASRYHAGFTAAMQFLEESRDRKLQEEREKASAQARYVKRMRRAALISGTFAIVALVGGWVAYINSQQAEKMRQMAEQVSAEATRQRDVAVAEREKARLSQARLLASLSEQQTASGDATNGILLALEALPNDSSDSERPYVPQAESALYKALYHHREQRVLRCHRGPVLSVTFRPKGDEQLVTACEDGTAQLWDATTGALLMTLTGHQGAIRSAEFSRDGTRIVTASDDGTARLWSSDSGEVELTLRGHYAPVQYATFSPDGQIVLTASADYSARLWDASSGETLGVLGEYEGSVKFAAFSPDGKLVTSTSEDGTVRLWDTASGRTTAVLRGHEGPVTYAEFSPDARLLVTTSDDATARLWDVTSGDALGILNGHQDIVRSAVFSPDGGRVITGSNDRTARLRSTADGAIVVVLYGHERGVGAIAFSAPDGKRIVTGTDSGTAHIWDASTGTSIAVLRGHKSEVTSVAFSPDGERVATASKDGTARVWKATTETNFTILSGHKDRVRGAALSPDGKRVITVSADGTGRVWNANTAEVIATLKGHEGQVLSGAFSPDGNRVLTGSADGTARIWDSDTGATLTVLKGHDSWVRAAAFSPDGGRIATASADHTVRQWDALSGKPLAVLRAHEDQVYSAAFSPDGTRIVTASADRTARLFNAGTNQSISILGGHEGVVRSAAFSPDGKLIVTASDDKTARLWDADTGESIRILSGHKLELRSAAFSPDGARVVTGSIDRAARIWDVETGATVAQLVGHKGTIRHTSFSKNGFRVLTTSSDRTARIWPVFPDTQRLIDHAKQVVPRQLTEDLKPQ